MPLKHIAWCVLRATPVALAGIPIIWGIGTHRGNGVAAWQAFSKSMSWGIVVEDRAVRAAASPVTPRA